MARDRRKNREKVKREAALDKKNAYGINDPTPYEADKKYNLDQRAGHNTPAVEAR